MTSLGLLQYSEINDNSTINVTDLEKKKQARHNITIKKRPTPASESESNVQNMLKLINNTNGYESDNGDSNGLVDFNPPPRAEVSSKEQSAQQSSQQATQQSIQPINTRSLEVDFEKPSKFIQGVNADQTGDNVVTAKPRQYPMPLDSHEGFSSLPKTYANDFYKQYVPYFNQTGSQTGNVNNKDQLLDKLNYMIHLLEEQKDEKTGHVMEEVILYSFLGVFIIFIVDSFARAGKYTR